MEVGVPSSKLKEPPKSCMPRRAKMKMKRKRRKSSERMEEIAFIRAMTRLRREDQYLEGRKKGGGWFGGGNQNTNTNNGWGSNTNTNNNNGGIGGGGWYGGQKNQQNNNNGWGSNSNNGWK